MPWTDDHNMLPPTSQAVRDLARKGMCLLFCLALHPAWAQTTPQVFTLAWGCNPAQAWDVLKARQPGAEPLIVSPETERSDTPDKPVDETVMLKQSAGVRYRTTFPAFYNLPAVVFLTFYNPAGTSESLALWKVEIIFPESGPPPARETAGIVFRDLTTLFKQKYGLEPDGTLTTPPEAVLSRGFSSGGVTVIFSVDGTTLRQQILYEKIDFRELVAAREKELERGASPPPEDVTGPVTKAEKHDYSKIRFSADARFVPFIYNAFENSHGDSIDIVARLGFPQQSFLLGGMFLYQYTSFDGMDPSSTFHGAWAVHELAAFLEIPVLEWLTVETGFGLGWRATAFEYQNLGVERQDEFGLLFYATAVFTPLDRFTFKAPLRLHLFFGEAGLLPVFYIGARAEYGLLNWLGLFAELGIQTWSYDGVLFSTAQGLFIMTLGATACIE